SSLPAVSSVLIAADLKDVEVLIEYSLPLTSKRLDILLLGTHAKSSGVSVVAWENKQWTLGDIENVEERLVRVLGRYCLHSRPRFGSTLTISENSHRHTTQSVRTEQGDY